MNSDLLFRVHSVNVVFESKFVALQKRELFTMLVYSCRGYIYIVYVNSHVTECNILIFLGISHEYMKKTLV